MRNSKKGAHLPQEGLFGPIHFQSNGDPTFLKIHGDGSTGKNSLGPGAQDIDLPIDKKEEIRIDRRSIVELRPASTNKRAKGKGLSTYVNIHGALNVIQVADVDGEGLADRDLCRCTQDLDHSAAQALHAFTVITESRFAGCNARGSLFSRLSVGSA